MKTDHDSPIFRAGDVVRHKPSGEEWVVAAISPRGPWLYPAGWPESRASIQECEMVKPATDAENVRMLLKAASSPSDTSRRGAAFSNLVDLHDASALRVWRQLARDYYRAQSELEKIRQALVQEEEKIRRGVFLPDHLRPNESEASNDPS